MIVKSEKYWADLLEQYKLGSISNKDRFELEKRALDDPFLFDALEGFSFASQSTDSQQNKKSKLLTLPRLATAASLIFLVAMIFLLKNDSTPETSSDQSIAMVLDTSPKESPTIEERENAPAEVQNTEKTETPTSSTTSTTSKNKSAKSKLPESNDNLLPVEIEETKEEIITEHTSSASTPMEKSSDDNHIPTSGENEVEEAIESDKKITASAKKEVYIPNSANKLDSNTSGSQLELENSASQVADNNVISSLPEAKRSKKEESISTFYKVEPAIGKKDFDEFVKESINNRGLRKDSPHNVTIEFNIDKDGVLSNFLHIYNGCSECGGYAIYLLSSSGLWKTIPEGQSGRARYTLEF
jgi:hypothetical protein